MILPLVRPLPLVGALALLALAACSSTAIDCPVTDEKCGEVCVNTKVDPAHCGGCNKACDALFVCQTATVDGEETSTCVCPEGQDCNPQACDGACTTGQHCIDDTCVAGDVFAACFQAGSVVPLLSGGRAVAGSPYTGIEGPQALAALDATHVLAVGSLDSVLYVIDRTTMQPVGSLPLLTTGGACPNQILVRDRVAYVVNSCVNSVEWIDLRDPAKPAVAGEVSLGAGSNPYGAAFGADGTLWVSLWLTDQVVPVSFTGGGGEGAPPAAGTAGTPVPIELAEGEGKPFPAGVAAIGDAMYVTLNNLDGTTYAPTGTGGKVAVIRGSQVDSILDLGAECKNAGFTATAGTTLWIACTGSYGAGDGQVVSLDTPTGQVTRRVNTGGAPARLSYSPAAGLWASDAASVDVMLIPPGNEPDRVAVCSEAMMEFVGDVLAY